MKKLLFHTMLSIANIMCTCSIIASIIIIRGTLSPMYYLSISLICEVGGYLKRIITRSLSHQ